MFKHVYLPEPIYERLPLIYLVLAVLVAVTPIGSIKWLVTAVLIFMSFAVKRQRQTFRDHEQLRKTAAKMKEHGERRRVKDREGRIAI